VLLTCNIEKDALASDLVAKRVIVSVSNLVSLVPATVNVKVVKTASARVKKSQKMRII
jgi:hypothetical protein